MVREGEGGEEAAGFVDELDACFFGDVVWEEEIAIFVEEGQLRRCEAFRVVWRW